MQEEFTVRKVIRGDNEQFDIESVIRGISSVTELRTRSYLSPLTLSRDYNRP